MYFNKKMLNKKIVDSDVPNCVDSRGKISRWRLLIPLFTARTNKYVGL